MLIAFVIGGDPVQATVATGAAPNKPGNPDFFEAPELAHNLSFTCFGWGTGSQMDGRCVYNVARFLMWN